MTQSTKQLQTTLSGLSPIDIRVELFRKGDYSFIVTGPDEDGDIKTHEKQREALRILMDNTYDEFLYGGAAGGAKSWTGCTWLLFMCLLYPETRYFVARNELKDIIDSVLVTWGKVCRAYGFHDWKYNAVRNYIQLGNGSHINLIELKWKPSDPDYADVGSTEYTCGWCEESSQLTEKGVDVIASRVGRHLNKKYGIRGKVLHTTNPEKNWTKTRFYDRARLGTLPEEHAYLQCLITENPFIEKEYVAKLRKMGQKNKALYERLFKGNWNYAENPNALCLYERIDEIFDNDHVEEGELYLTADIARLGSDKARIVIWKGWKAIDHLSFDISKTTEISNAINLFRRKYQISKSRCVADEDGVGGGVVDETGILGFKNNATPIKEQGDMPNYRNLQVQCLYILADRINEGSIWLDLDVTDEEKELIKEELDQIQSNLSDYGKLDVKRKSDIKRDIGRSPDWRDCFAPDTKVLTSSGYVNISEIKKGDYVVTPHGNRKVIDTIERDAPEKLYDVNGVKVTGNHKFFTKKGLISADALTMNDYIYTDNIVNLIIWKLERLFSTKSLNIGFQKRQKNITTQTPTTTAKEQKSPYTEGYTKIILGRFLKVMTYIILMKIPLTILQATWRWLKALFTSHTTPKNDGKKKGTENQGLKTLKKCRTKPKNGISLKKEVNGIRNTLKTQDSGIMNQQKGSVKIATKPSSKRRLIQNFAQIIALKNITTKQKNTTKIGFAKSAQKYTLLERMKRTKPAHVLALQNTDGKIGKVYTLTVEKDNCYFAEGMLVENCLMMRVYFDIYHTSPLVYSTKKTLAQLGIAW